MAAGSLKAGGSWRVKIARMNEWPAGSDTTPDFPPHDPMRPPFLADTV